MLKPLIIIAAFSLPLSAAAQSNDAKAQKERENAELRVESEMVQLNSIVEAMSMNLGQLHYLRTLCFGNNDQKWRESASQMMNVEAPNDGARRKNLIQAFNKGYFLEKDRHQSCSQSVSLDVAALAENGRKLAGMLGDPYRED
ncbi:MAG: TIGR02301 family protein [Hellea sp.]|nr:TIGR02301 family protein [Hellea sp.]